MDELQVIIDAIIPGIKETLDIPLSSFNLWFGGLTLKSLDDKEALFVTPTELRRKVLESRYYDIISDHLTACIGFEVKLKFESKEANGEDPFKQNVQDAQITETPEQAKEGKERAEMINLIINDDEGNEQKRTVVDEYTFDNFIEGSSNKFAKAVCYAVARAPSTDYNPLFIYGNSGLGKTHLLCAIINYMKLHKKANRIVYKKCEEFMNELIEAISTYTTKQFKEKYRSADVLLIDDIQFIAGKVSTQEEFFHTFSYLYESNKQIILTSDRPPHEIKPLEDRLLTRFEGGLMADIQPPSPELRTAIIRKKSEQMKLNIPNDLVEYMAERLHENIRQIEGVLKRLHAMFSMSDTVVTKEAVDKVISMIDPGNIPPDILINRIIESVANYFGVTVEAIKSKAKTDAVANARHAAIYIIRKMTDKSYKEVGQIFSRDHSTAMASFYKAETLIKTKKNYDNDIKKIMKEVKGG